MKYLTDKRWRRLTAVALAVVLQLGLFVAWRAGWTHQANRGIYDQLMRFTWQYLLPGSIVYMIITALLVLFFK